MEWVKLFVELLKVMLWPAVAVLLGLKYREPVAKLLERARKVKGPGFEGEFGDVPRLEPVEVPRLEPTKEGPKALPPGQEKTPATAEQMVVRAEPGDAPELRVPIAEADLVTFAPAGAVINAWAHCEDVMRREAERLTGDDLRLRNPRQVIAILEAKGVLRGETIGVAKTLNLLRNRVAHSRATPTIAEAQDFVQTSQDLIRVVEVGADEVRAGELVAQLGTTDPRQLRVRGPHDASMIKRSKWTAIHGDTRIVIPYRDAVLLLGLGARLEREPGPDPASDR